MRPLSYSQLSECVQAQGYVWFDGGDFDLNLVGVRHSDCSANSFNDHYYIAFTQGDERLRFCFDCTTDPGVYYRNHPMNLKGTAILKPGQYRGAFTLGRHQGKYAALVQASPLTVYRDNDRDHQLDADNEDTGMFGINHHRANVSRRSTQVDKWSAGCQVLADPNDFELFITLCRKASALWGDRFSYTLLTEDQLCHSLY